MFSSRWQKLALLLLLSCVMYDPVSCSKKEPCTDYPSCQLISEKMFENYCSRSTLKNMCPTHCDKSCQPQQSKQVMSAEQDEETPTQSNEVSTTPATSSTLNTAAEEDTETDEETSLESTTTTTTTSTTGRRKAHKHRRPNHKKISLATTTTTMATMSSSEDPDNNETTTTTTTAASKLKFSTSSSSNRPPLHTEIPDSSSETTRRVPSNLPNGTIYVPLFEAGFVQRVIPTSSKEGYDFSKGKVCKKLEDCSAANAWCPLTNDIPKEQLEILLNYTTDIYMLETQGAVFGNETVTSFLFQYLNEAGMLVSRLFRTESNNSTEISKFKFEPPFRTNYIRITPIDFTQSIAFRFEIYSKGILYNPSSD